MIKESSYMAAGAIPTKLLHNKIIKDGRIMPLHLQLSPTNACNLTCSFCSCSDVDRKKELTLEQMMDVIDICKVGGTKAITITGGGEPLMHPKINELILYAKTRKLKVGLSTNGILLNRLEHHENLTWCRISTSDERVNNYPRILDAMKMNPRTDWAFAHVLSKNPNYKTIEELIRIANSFKNITHVKIHPNLFNIYNVPIGDVKKFLEDKDGKVIYQDRSNITKGTKDCYISLLKPMVAPEGIFPCCGAQYAIHGQKRDMVEEMKMGELKDLAYILDNQKHFDGSICNVCYYSQYNDALSKMKDKPKHEEFV